VLLAVAVILAYRYLGDVVIYAGIAIGVLRLGYPAYQRLKGQAGGRASFPGGADPLAGVLERGRGRGVYLGVNARGEWAFAGWERATLVLGPPRSGKTQALVIPAVLGHAGALVSASTKPDVIRATSRARSRLGRVWEFDPTGQGALLPDRQLRWSPVTCAKTWDGALLMARAMVSGAGVGAGTSDQTHWARRAVAVLAPLLHAAALGDHDIGTLTGWVHAHDLDQPALVLNEAGAVLASGVLAGVQNTEARERSSILSAAADALEAYTSTGALTAAQKPNFDARRFVGSSDTIYIHAPAERQGLAAPLVCGLLSEIRAATYKLHREQALNGRVLFALDEAANIAPLEDLPQIASEGGGQGLELMACFQDLSQARARWGHQADGFLTLFSEKLILPGIADPKTIEAISLALGEYDRQLVSTTRAPMPGQLYSKASKTFSTVRQRVLSPGEIAGIPHGCGLHLRGVEWELLTLTPAYRDQPWQTLCHGARKQP
jgi:type IV secretion system protein VirD4